MHHHYIVKIVNLCDSYFSATIIWDTLPYDTAILRVETLKKLFSLSE